MRCVCKRAVRLVAVHARQWEQMHDLRGERLRTCVYTVSACSCLVRNTQQWIQTHDTRGERLSTCSSVCLCEYVRVRVAAGMLYMCSALKGCFCYRSEPARGSAFPLPPLGAAGIRAPRVHQRTLSSASRGSPSHCGCQASASACITYTLRLCCCSMRHITCDLGPCF